MPLDEDMDGAVIVLDAWKKFGKQKKEKSLAARMRDAARTRYAWTAADERKHPRGQPSNAGQFREKGSPSVGKFKPAEKTAEQQKKDDEFFQKERHPPEKQEPREVAKESFAESIAELSKAGKKKLEKLIEKSFDSYRRGGDVLPRVSKQDLGELFEWVQAHAAKGHSPPTHQFSTITDFWRKAFNNQSYAKLKTHITERAALSKDDAAVLDGLIDEIAETIEYDAERREANRPKEPLPKEIFPELEHFHDAFTTVMEKVSPKALARAARSIKVLRFYPDLKKLNEAANGTPEEAIAGLFSWGDRAIWLDGSGMDDNKMSNVYAHEFWHAVDWNGKDFDTKKGGGEGALELSTTKEWNEAWTEDIHPKNGFFWDGWWYKGDNLAPLAPEDYPLTAYATTSPEEGFAEYGRLVVNSPKVAKEKFPKAWAFLESEGLV